MKFRIHTFLATVLFVMISGMTAIAAETLIVKFGPGASEANINALNAGLGASIIRHFRLIEARHIRLPGGVSVEQALRHYRSSRLVIYAEPDYRVHANAQAFPDDPMFNQLWGLHNTGQTGGAVDADIDAPEAWSITTGSLNSVVAILDTGIDYSHQDLQGNIRVNPGEDFNGNGIWDAPDNNGVDDDGNGYIDDVIGWDFVNNDNDPFDDNGHGSHVSGIIAASGDNGVGDTGVNWQAGLMALKFLNSFGSGTTSNAILAIEYYTMMGVKVSNNSWGGGAYSQALYDAIQASNSLFVAAAGGSGGDNDVNPSYPSSYDLDNIVAVAASDHNDALAPFSSWGLVSVDMAAPGVNILSTWPGNAYLSLSGTSMSTAYVSGAAALLLADNPARTVAEVKWRLLSGTDDKGLPVFTGGRLNVFNALTLAAGTLTISPATGMLLTTQTVDVALIAEGGVATLVSATFDGANITGFLGGCLAPGTLIPPSPTGSTLTCPGVRGSQMGAGTHTFSVTVEVGGTPVSDTVTWDVLNATQP